MYDFINEIFDKYQVRKSYNDKSKFIEYLESIFNKLGIKFNIDNHGRMIKSRNIIVGDIDEADTIFTAHYDTCAKLPFPNFITPKNIFIYLLYSLFLAFLIILSASICAFIAELLFHKSLISRLIYMFILFMDIYLMIFGKPNRHTANDNTSGVITLLTIIHGLDREYMDKTAFVFFDNEEAGLVGSSAFKKKYKNLNDKLIINFDCVSDGDNIMFVCSKKAKFDKKFEILEENLNKEKENYKKNVLIENTKNTFYPSDQMIFKNSIGVAVLKKKPIMGYYMDKIHTNKDIVFDKRNIDFISKVMINVIENDK
ncbi:M28 family peptidase [Anaerofustis stercorihominis]|uniref:M28 family peptidase n=1 Tax=Anaerofustis stercorihominis TaxID=214853 RepID=UPI00214C2CDD|nr:M28 family peptidase [Anaerofustis stercorihominis]MCR2032566.1 M28 family peptidase [Anaerofustis stercorihominis]